MGSNVSSSAEQHSGGDSRVSGEAGEGRLERARPRRSSLLRREGTRPLPGLSSEQLGAIPKLAQACVVDPNPMRRKQALFELLDILLNRDITSLRSGHHGLLESVSLAVSLSIVSTDDETQCTALSGCLKLCEKDGDVLGPLLLSKGTITSIATLLKRDSTTLEATRLCIRLLSLVFDPSSSTTIPSTVAAAAYEIPDRILDAGERLGKMYARESLIILSVFPISSVWRSDRILKASRAYVLETGPSAVEVIQLNARIILERGGNDLKELLNVPGLADVFRLSNLTIARRAVINGAVLYEERMNDTLLNVVTWTLIDFIREKTTFYEGVTSARVLAMNHEKIASSFCDHGFSQVIRDIQAASSSGALSTSNYMPILASLFCIVLCEDAFDSKDISSHLHSLVSLAGSFGLQSTTIGYLVENMQNGLRDLDSFKMDAIETLLVDTNKAQKIDQPEPSAELRHLAGVVMLRHILLHRGWIRGELYTGGSYSEAMQREESDQMRGTFIWEWRQSIVDALATFCSSESCQAIAFGAAKCLELIPRLDGPDLLDGLFLHSNWEMSTIPGVPVELARPEKFRMLNYIPPEPLQSDLQTKGLKGGIFGSGLHAIDVARRDHSSEPNAPGLNWTVSVWIKQIKPALTSAESMRPRCILGIQNSSAMVLGFNENMHLGLCASSEMDNEWSLFGPWEQLPSGWHQITVTCREVPHVTGLDMILGRTLCITCFVDGQHFGASTMRHPAQVPRVNVAKGFVLGCIGVENQRSGLADFGCLGEEFALNEVRIYGTGLSERDITCSVARSSFQRRPNWVISMSSSNTRHLSAHIWARLQLARNPLVLSAIRNCVQASPNNAKVRIGLRLLGYIATIPEGKKRLLESGLDLGEHDDIWE